MEVVANIIPNWVDYATLGIGAITAGAVVVVLLQLSSMEKARHSQALLHFIERWDSEEMVKARQAVNDFGEDKERLAKTIETADENNSMLYFTLTRVAGFFEDLGYAWRAGYVKLDDVLKQFGGSIEWYYKFYETYIARYKQMYKDKKLGIEPPNQSFTDLYEKLMGKKGLTK